MGHVSVKTEYIAVFMNVFAPVRGGGGGGGERERERGGGGGNGALIRLRRRLKNDTHRLLVAHDTL